MISTPAPSNLEWVDSIYTTNKILLKHLPLLKNFSYKFIFEYLNLNFNIHAFSVSPWESLNKIVLSVPRFKFYLNKIIINLYVYNKEKIKYIKLLQKLFVKKFTKTKFINNNKIWYYAQERGGFSKIGRLFRRIVKKSKSINKNFFKNKYMHIFNILKNKKLTNKENKLKFILRIVDEYKRKNILEKMFYTSRKRKKSRIKKWKLFVKWMLTSKNKHLLEQKIYAMDSIKYKTHTYFCLKKTENTWKILKRRRRINRYKKYKINRFTNLVLRNNIEHFKKYNINYLKINNLFYTYLNNKIITLNTMKNTKDNLDIFYNTKNNKKKTSVIYFEKWFSFNSKENKNISNNILFSSSSITSLPSKNSIVKKNKYWDEKFIHIFNIKSRVNISILKIFIKNKLQNFYQKKIILSKLYLNIIKFNKINLLNLANILNNIYQKKIYINIISLKHVYLDNNILSSAIIYKFNDRNKNTLKVLKKAMFNTKLSTFNKIFQKDNYIDIFNLFRCKDFIFNNNFNKQTSAFNYIKDTKIAGMWLTAKGRLTHRLTAQRSLFKVRYKGSLQKTKNIGNTKKYKGYIDSNIDYVNINSSNRLGSYSIKSWINTF